MKIKSLLLCALMGCTAVAAKAQEASATGNAAIDNILSRASVRQFDTERPVEQAKLDLLLRAGQAAPSSRDMRPWHFVVIRGEEAIGKYAATNPRHGERLKATPLIILVCGDKERFQPGDAEPFWTLDCSAAAENILLAAHAQGLGAVWMSVYPEERKMNGIARSLSLPENLVPFAQLRIGYPAEPLDVKDKWDEAKITYWE